MSADRGQLRTMRLLPFTAAADEAAWVADPRHDRRQGPASKRMPRMPGLAVMLCPQVSRVLLSRLYEA